jgi:tetratricopeptide (TPR) repeat protein
MTSNHILLYRLAERMLEEQKHVLAVDTLFDDDVIADFVKSIQIDSPYQQMLLEGVLTESVRDEKLYVSFTVEGYFHFVLGEVIFVRTDGLGAEALMHIVEHNKLNGATEGVEQCLIRDVKNRDLSRLMWLIDAGKEVLDVCSIPLAHAFLQIKSNPKTEVEWVVVQNTQIKTVLEELLSNPSDNDMLVLEKSIQYLIDCQRNLTVEALYSLINKTIQPDSAKRALLYLKSIKYTPANERKVSLKKVELFKLHPDNENAESFYFHLGEQYNFIGDYNTALDCFHKSLDIQITTLGMSHPFVAKSYGYIGSVCHDIGNYEKALDFLGKSLIIELNLKTESNIDIAWCYNSIGLVWYSKGDYDKALEFYEKSLETNLKTLGGTHYKVAANYNNIGLIWHSKGIFKKAIDYFEKSLAIKHKAYGVNHETTAATYSNMGLVWYLKSDYNKALEYHIKSLEIRLKINGGNHESIAIDYNNIGTVHYSMENYLESLTNYEKSLSITSKSLGDAHPKMATLYNNIGLIWKALGNFDKTLEFYQKSLDIELNKFGENHESIAIRYNNIGTLWISKGDYDKALELYEKSLEIRLKTLGDNHDQVAQSYENIGFVLKLKGKYDIALKYYLESLSILLLQLGDVYHSPASAYYGAGDCFYHLKKYEDALSNFTKGYDIQLAGGFPFRIAECWIAIGNKKEALNYFIQSAEIRNEQLGIDDESTKSAIQKSKEIALELNQYEQLPQWIKEFKDDL